MVATALSCQGWIILARNFRHVACEIDIIATKGETLICVEVKARRWEPKYATELSQLLPPGKRAALRRGIERFLTMRPHLFCRDLRFDLALVVGDERCKRRIAYHVNV